jgi:pimeloyl-ACP methyl ester carboxylesterase
MSEVKTPPLEKTTVAIRGGRQQTVFRGGEGPALVWLHPANGIVDTHPLVDALCERFSVFAPLAPGFTDLAELDDVRNIHELAMRYDDVLEALGLDDICVVGHSFGGMIAAELAAHYPRRVKELVLIAPVGLWNDDYPVIDFFAVPVPKLPDVLYADKDVAARDFPPPDEDAEPDVEMLVMLVQGMTSVAKFMWPIPDRGLARRLDRIRARTLVVFGEEDALVPPRYADDFVSGIPAASKVLIPGAGHMVPVERPTEVLEAIDRFL